MEIRRVKSPEEVEIVRQGSRIAELGAYAGIKTLHEGVPEYEVVIASNSAMMREVAVTFPQIDIRDSKLSEFWFDLQQNIFNYAFFNFIDGPFPKNLT